MPQEDATLDDLLVQRLLERDEAAWEGLLAGHGPMIAATCRRALMHAGSPADAPAEADAVAEVFRALLSEDCRILRRFRPGASLGAYLHVIARNRTLSLARRGAPARLPWLAPPAGPESAEALALAAERAETLRRALQELGGREAELLRLFHLSALGYREISVRTGIPETQVGVLLSRAREALRARLGREFPEFL